MNRNKAHGDEFERAVASVFRALGHYRAERVLRLGAHDDRGDITGLDTIVPVHIDCKWRAENGRLELGKWFDECLVEAPDGTVPFLVVRRPRRNALHAYVVTDLNHFASLMKGGNG